MAPSSSAVLCVEQPQFTARHWLSLAATSVLHLLYSLSLQRGYRVSDLSVVYPIARGTGPLLSFVGAAVLLGETPTTHRSLGRCSSSAASCWLPAWSVTHERAPGRGVFYGLLTGALIAAYTFNDGWAVKVLLISPFVIDFTGNRFA